MASMWRQVSLPTVSLGALWIVHSLATTAYVPWQNRRQKAALDSNLSATEATLQLQERVSRLEFLAVYQWPSSTDEMGPAEEAIETQVAQLKQRFHDQESVELLAELESKIQRLQRQIASRQSADGTFRPPSVDPVIGELANEITVLCNNLVRRRELILKNTIDQRSQTDVVVMIVRAVLLVAGLLIGIGLVWWISQELRRTISQVIVTLRGAEGDLPTEIGRIDVMPAGGEEDFSALQTYAQRVSTTIHQVASDLHQARQELVRGERLAAVGELAAGVAHEIRNPLTSVRLIVQRAAERGTVTQEQLQVLNEEMGRIETTVQRLLDLARPAEPNRTRCDLAELTRRSLKLVEVRALAQHVTSSPQHIEECFVRADIDLLQQVIVNLLINALEAMPDGGRLTLRLTQDEAAAQAVLEVEDSGKGIAPELLGQIFDPFVTTKARGSGLGLAISRRIALEHGGSLSAKNNSGGGALFTLRIPAESVSAGWTEGEDRNVATC